MSQERITDMGHSIRARIKNLSDKKGLNFDYLLLRYAYERFLYRLGKSPYVRHFILKGACAFSIWTSPLFRVTRDADLLCFGDSSPARLLQCFRDICDTPVDPDGVRFDIASLEAQEIKKDAKYHGTRILFKAYIQSARVTLQFDIGFGDGIYPAPELQAYPGLLGGLNFPQILIYTRQTIVAEKYEAIVSRGMLNSRLKDYFDLWIALKNDPTAIFEDNAITLLPGKTTLTLTTGKEYTAAKVKKELTTFHLRETY